ncbi:hypothetical protein ACFY8C_39820 [Streptomyces flavochromogenes]|uniref:Helicase n=1 Tax=Streptomyces flavochromogenes TaxID=68199 RepID=A0ABW6Y3N3_9ACTN
MKTMDLTAFCFFLPEMQETSPTTARPTPWPAAPQESCGCTQAQEPPVSSGSGARSASKAACREVRHSSWLTALAQYIQREGRTVVGRAHVEVLPDGSSIKPDVFLSNQKARRYRLNADQLAALAELGYAWAAGQSRHI